MHPHSFIRLDPNPHQVNADPKHCRQQSINEIVIFVVLWISIRKDPKLVVGSGYGPELKVLDPDSEQDFSLRKS
jgi:hypothetical protein